MRAALLITRNNLKGKIVMDAKIKGVIAALEKNNMQGIYVPCINSIPETVEKMLFDGALITAGGSVSVHESGVWELINKECYNFLDRNREGITPEEQQEVFKSCVGADFYFCSTNAITENGELINVDGFSNRIASIAFGPKRVIMIVGCNKIVKNVEEGLLRIKKITAPKNCVRLGIDSPCSKLGHCVSLLKSDNPNITAGCSYERRICANYLISSYQRIRGRITVILCGEELGY